MDEGEPADDRGLHGPPPVAHGQRRLKPLAPLSPPGRGEKYALLILLLACIFFFGRLTLPLLEPEEARYAEIPRQMLAEGRWLTPILHGETYLHKPPLLYWLVMACYRVFGVHDWAARLVPAFAGVATIIITYIWGRRVVGPAAGLLAAGILCLSARFLYLGGMLSMDGLLGLWVIAALASAHVALTGNELARRWWLTSAVCCGLGILTKGPVAIVLVVVPIAIWNRLESRCARVGWRASVAYLAVAAAIAGPWFMYMAWQTPSAAGSFFWLHNIVRYLAPFDHEKPAWFYLPSLFAGMLPWSLLLVPMAPFLLDRSSHERPRRPAALWFFITAFAWCLLFFSLSGCKRQGYIIPAFPLLALALGTYLVHGQPWRSMSARPLHAATTATLAIGIGTMIAAGLSELLAWPTVVALSALLAGVAIAHRLLRNDSRLGALRWNVGIVAGLLALGMATILPQYHRRFSLRDQAEAAADVVRDPSLPVVSSPKRWDSFTFYWQRPVDAFLADEVDRLHTRLNGSDAAVLIVKRESLDVAVPSTHTWHTLSDPTARVVVGLVRRKVKSSVEP